ncbi:L-rhamnose mutarotase [Heyndrickxia ginsengihumi]|uniref:L-rhamnose mutarotase n=1 Tax=Heyndrickxia ginsengihumi TaxID=363870 RepID=A0A0A6VGZ0_9BACI|nr:L-rhamnose mutarotase [Heyndrickxia ginsengihumi]KHD85894.1 L-rhamnose mutarotase [Heyndrickxia ginsengihumi]MBE6185183.1 L-rhamnose mutarotase [Bacillus sp. (in: firmicutes)]NEY18869.1 L-rhamnose mutarotase [Heyndrickxia ginsengihumi]
MIRKASIMFLYKDHYEEYKRRHDELWPEMAKALKDHGAHNYSIFLDKETGRLFAYLEVEDEAMYEQIAATEICKKWWSYMEPLMETNEDSSPVSIDLEEVFHLV